MGQGHRTIVRPIPRKTIQVALGGAKVDGVSYAPAAASAAAAPPDALHADRPGFSFPTARDVTRKARPNLLRRMNERTVFELIRRSGPTSRADLKRHMGVSAPTVSKAVAHLLDAGFLEEVGTAPVGGAGRPVVVYRLASGTAQVIGASIGVRDFTLAPATLDGTIDAAAARTFPMPRSYPALIDALAAAVRPLMDRPGVNTLGLGVSAPGEIDARSQRILLSPNLRMLDGRSPSLDLRSRLGIDVTLVHDIVAGGLAEQQYGIARDMTDFVRIGVYEGFGASVVAGGRLLEGRRGLAGELGHVTVDLDGELCGCGNRGCLETVATDVAFARAVSRRLRRKLEVEHVFELARQGKIDVGVELDRTLSYLAVGVAAAINLFNPEAVLVCSRMFDLDPTAFERLQQMAAARALDPLMEDCRILRSNPWAPLGSVAAILHHLTDTLGPTVR